MKKLIFFIVLPLISYSQFEYAIKLHNNAREIYTNFSIDKFQLDENNFGKISLISHSDKQAEDAQKRAEILAEEFFKWHDSDFNKNFWFTEIAIGNDGSKILLSDKEYITNAVLNWTQLEFDYEEYLNGKELCYRSEDISDFLKVVWGNNTTVGFGVAKSESYVFVVASYGNKALR